MGSHNPTASRSTTTCLTGTVFGSVPLTHLQTPVFTSSHTNRFLFRLAISSADLVIKLGKTLSSFSQVEELSCQHIQHIHLAFGFLQLLQSYHGPTGSFSD
ncbi:hypothetical protein ILYODFUR_013558 [Ilyodon furcidens]|uniref:Uncharacterized protein n=1 Tax=Ilyodon furcidens TaxID=33524 RepID=A0ABV0T0E9_9TELE